MSIRRFSLRREYVHVDKVSATFILIRSPRVKGRAVICIVSGNHVPGFRAFSRSKSVPFTIAKPKGCLPRTGHLCYDSVPACFSSWLLMECNDFVCSSSTSEASDYFFTITTVSVLSSFCCRPALTETKRLSWKIKCSEYFVKYG